MAGIETSEEITCEHIPQCIIRAPKPPPFGPETLDQFNTFEVLKSEELKVKAIVEKIKDFVKREPQ